MKACLTLCAVPLMIGVAFAQSTPANPPAEPSSANQSNAKASNQPASSTMQPAEMKTMTYKGTLVDLGCGAGSQNSASTSTPSENANANANENSNTANRAAGDTSSCAVSANTSQFGLKTDGGQTYRFDLVGNQRAQDEFKNNKHWTSAASGNKPLKVKISGVVQGDKLIVSSIH